MVDEFVVVSKYVSEFNKKSDGKILAECNSKGNILFYRRANGNSNAKNGWDYRYVIKLNADDNTYYGFDMFVESDTNNLENLSEEHKSEVREVAGEFIKDYGWTYKKPLFSRSVNIPASKKFKVIGICALIVSAVLLKIALGVGIQYMVECPVLFLIIAIWFLLMGFSVFRIQNISIFTIGSAIGEIIFLGTLFGLRIFEYIMRSDLSELSIQMMQSVDTMCLAGAVIVFCLYLYLGCIGGKKQKE